MSKDYPFWRVEAHDAGPLTEDTIRMAAEAINRQHGPSCPTIVTDRITRACLVRHQRNVDKYLYDMRMALAFVKRWRPWRWWWWRSLRLLLRRERYWHVPHWKHRKGRAQYDTDREVVRAELTRDDRRDYDLTG